MIKVNANQRFNLDDECVPWWPFYPFGGFDLLAIAPSGLEEKIFVSHSVSFVNKTVRTGLCSCNVIIMLHFF